MESFGKDVWCIIASKLDFRSTINVSDSHPVIYKHLINNNALWRQKLLNDYKYTYVHDTYSPFKHYGMLFEFYNLVKDKKYDTMLNTIIEKKCYNIFNFINSSKTTVVNRIALKYYARSNNKVMYKGLLDLSNPNDVVDEFGKYIMSSQNIYLCAFSIRYCEKNNKQMIDFIYSLFNYGSRQILSEIVFYSYGTDNIKNRGLVAYLSSKYHPSSFGEYDYKRNVNLLTY